MPLLLSDHSDSLLQKAEQVSLQLGHYYLGCEHVFMAAMEGEQWLRSALQSQGIDTEEVRHNILNICGPGDDAPPWEGVPKTPRLKQIIKNAQAEAESVRAYRVEPCHILSAIFQEGRSVPARVLEGIGASMVSLRQSAVAAGTGGEPSRKPVPPAQGPYPGAGRPYGVMMPGSPPPQARPQGARMGMPAPSQGAPQPQGAPREKPKSKTPNLDKLGRDMVEMARQGKIDPIVGRTQEIRRVLQTLTKKTKNNPIIIGEAGVGKTAVVYGLAQRIAEGKVPDAIRNKRLVELGMASIVAGAKHRGEFEERMQNIIDEVIADRDVILFIDEIHTIIGAGDSRGGMDAGNILKPYLARSEVTIIGATTIEEYRKYVEKDPALERRFQPVMVDQPTEDQTVEILNGLKERYEKHHGVIITAKAILAAVKMSVRYIPDRNLPDKAIDLIDEAAAKSQMIFTSFSGAEDLEGSSNTVTEENIAEVISLWTGIPAAKLSQEESERLLHIEDYIRERVVGQEQAVRIVAQTIRMARMGLCAPNRPTGVFLFLGPTGVGKTELAKSLAEFLFGSERDLVRLDMSEFMEKHAISRMIGSPPGYIGHEEEGQLTSAVRTKPYSVVLLDEVEKAHPDVFDIFLQVFDDGRLTDSKGRTVNFTNCILIMTSNIGMSSLNADGVKRVIDTADPRVRDEIMSELRHHFRPEFLNRIDEIVIFNSLSDEALENIVNIGLGKLSDQLFKQREIRLVIDESVARFLMKRGYDPAYGARPMKRAIANFLSKPLAEAMLAGGVASESSLFARFENGAMIFEKEEEGEFWRYTPPTDHEYQEKPQSPQAPPPWEAQGAPGHPPALDGGNSMNGKGTTPKMPAHDPRPIPPSPPRASFPTNTGEDSPGLPGGTAGNRPDPVQYMKTPFDKRQPVLRSRTPEMDIMGIAPMKGPMGPFTPKGEVDDDDLSDTRPGGNRT